MNYQMNQSETPTYIIDIHERQEVTHVCVLSEQDIEKYSCKIDAPASAFFL